MLSAQARPYIDASVPVLREHGVAITRHFYASMFAAQPELKNLFNMGNQANGSQQQSLAAAVFAYAANIDNAAALAPVIERIVHKHVSVGIRPAHYPIVGKHLLAAIASVLGEQASAPLLAAWDEAYWLLACELIACEARLYKEAQIQPGELMSVTVKRIVQESADVVSFYLQNEAGTAPGAFLPGQYISVEMQQGETRQLRQYSLSDAAQSPWWRISVKREDARPDQPSGQVSNWLHENVKVGDVLQVSPAFGNFAPELQANSPITLISAGIGITPMVAILNTLRIQASPRKINFIHAARDSQHHSLRQDLPLASEKLANFHRFICYETPLANDVKGLEYDAAGLLDLQQALHAEDLAGEFYLCGPVEFMQSQWRSLISAKVSPSQIEREVFGPDLLGHLI